MGEIGFDMSRFPSGGHVVSWGRLCPGERESAHKRKAARMRKGSEALRAVFVLFAPSSLPRQGHLTRRVFRQVMRRDSKKQVAAAVAHEILVACWCILSTTRLPRTGPRRTSSAHRRSRSAVGPSASCMSSGSV